LFCFGKELELSNHKKLKLKHHIEEEGEKNKPSSNPMCTNLEKMLIRIQKSLFSSQITDEHLRKSILKEIIECQRLILLANLNSKDLNAFESISINEIYNEWKNFINSNEYNKYEDGFRQKPLREKKAK
jgi:hypothetical protein